MRGELLYGILGLIEEAAWTISDIMSVATLPYGSSHGKIMQHFARRQRQRRSFVDALRRYVKNRQKFYELLYRLRRDNLIQEEPSKKSGILRLTTKGKEKLKNLRKRKETALPRPTAYVASQDTAFTIIVFDIPERKRALRHWLRSVLRHIGFTMLQKSVWLGRKKLPRDFLEDLDRLQLFDYVEIFEISKGGTLKQIG